MILGQADYPKILKSLQDVSEPERLSHIRYLARTDLYFMIRYIFNRKDFDHSWLFDRCREVQAAPDGYLDLWPRDHRKSSAITYAKTIQDILVTHGKDAVGQEVTVGIFSHTRPIAKSFLRQIKRELESNQVLISAFPDVLFDNPEKQAGKWSEDDGLIVRRKSNPKEATVEAWGLVDGQPIGKHFNLMVYDDIVTAAAVNTPEMIEKTTAALELSYSLGTLDGKRRFIGTRYHFNDPYRTIMARGTAIPRIYTATDNGEIDGTPVFLTQAQFNEKRRDTSPYIFSSQYMQNPKADETQGFLEKWLKYYDVRPTLGAVNTYIVIDPASGKKKHNDYTAAFVLGLGQDENIYVMDMVRDRLNLEERGRLLMAWHRKYKPREVRYEKYGLQADIEYIKQLQAQQTYRFDIIEVGGGMAKADRIKRLIPYFSQGRVYLPEFLWYTNYEGTSVDLINDFVQQEYKGFPVALHDDMMDALARIAEPDLPLQWPKPVVDTFMTPARTHKQDWRSL